MRRAFGASSGAAVARSLQLGSHRKTLDAGPEAPGLVEAYVSADAASCDSTASG